MVYFWVGVFFCICFTKFANLKTWILKTKGMVMIELAIVFSLLILLVIFTKRRIRTRVQNCPDEIPRKATKKNESNEKLRISCVSKSIEKKLVANLDWLSEEWSQAQENKEANNGSSFLPSWYYDESTDNQYAYLNSLGVEINKGKLNKGEMSDLIGIFKPIDDRNKELLKFFKVPLTGLNQTKARYEVNKLLSNPENVTTWEQRPANTLQKEFYRFFSLKAPAGLTFSEAKTFIDEFERDYDGDFEYHLEDLKTDEQIEFFKRNQLLLEDWRNFEEIVLEFEDSEFRDSYEIKKPTISLMRKAIAELKKENVTMEDASSDIELVVEKLLQIKPELSKA